jgi:hypothetical protein
MSFPFHWDKSEKNGSDTIITTIDPDMVKKNNALDRFICFSFLFVSFVT